MQDWIVSILGSINNANAISLSIALNIVISVLGFIPSIVITTANIAVFGPLAGFIISFIGEVLGAQVAFYLYRFGFKKPIQKRMQNSWGTKIINQTDKMGFIIVLQGRLIPFVPSSLVTFYAAVGKIHHLTFFAASTLGKLPAMLLEGFAAYGILQMNSMLLQVGIALFVFLIVLQYLRKRSSEKCNKI